MPAMGSVAAIRVQHKNVTPRTRADKMSLIIPAVLSPPKWLLIIDFVVKKITGAIEKVRLTDG